MFCFPEAQEVRLRRAPLSEVICQVRFPPILRILSEQPVVFQEKVRASFPQLQVDYRIGMTFDDSVPVREVAPRKEARVFRFLSSDNGTAISLASNFVTVSTTAYQHWDGFVVWLRLALDALRESYAPVYAHRVGLRYVNNVSSGNTGFHEVRDLVSVINPSLTKILDDPCWSEPPEMASTLTLPAGEAETLVLRSGLRREDDPKFVLDLDYAQSGQISFDDIIPLCDRFHGSLYRAFRWCIRVEKLGVFDPDNPAKGG